MEAVTPITDENAETETQFRRVIDINVIGTDLTTRAAVPLMQSGGRILVSASIWGTTAEPTMCAYIASKLAK